MDRLEEERRTHGLGGLLLLTGRRPEDVGTQVMSREAELGLDLPRELGTHWPSAIEPLPDQRRCGANSARKFGLGACLLNQGFQEVCAHATTIARLSTVVNSSADRPAGIDRIALLYA